jgi:hypothetical protein
LQQVAGKTAPDRKQQQKKNIQKKTLPFDIFPDAAVSTHCTSKIIQHSNHQHGWNGPSENFHYQRG